MTLKQIVGNNNKVHFSHYRDGNFFYVVEVEGKKYSFNFKGMRLLKRQSDGSWKFAVVGLKNRSRRKRGGGKHNPRAAGKSHSRSEGPSEVTMYGRHADGHLMMDYPNRAIEIFSTDWVT